MVKISEFPKQIIIETTAFCTQRCIHCAHKTLQRKKGKMTMSLYKKIIDEIAAEAPDIEVWMTYYGEALILKYQLYYMIRYAKDKGLTYTILNSNAMLLDREMAEMLIDSGLDRFIISMDGFSKETYERIRVGGIYENVFNNALQFLKILKKRKLSKPKFEMQFSILEENEHELEAFNQFWKSKGAFVKNRPKASWTGRIEAKNLDPTLKRYPCKWGLNNGAILWDGLMVACAGDSEGLFVAGDINKSPIKEIWNSTHKLFRQIHLDERWEDLPDICKGCLDWQTTERKYVDPKMMPKARV
ncbi:MAG: radical SAM protein [Gammaproteobacteria bacterium]|nr:radical SAM protein [Gammaproteobacteria bacterium]